MSSPKIEILSGSLKGQFVPVPPGLRNSMPGKMGITKLFRMLEGVEDWASQNVLVLFSGAGSVALEFFSRGAKNVSSVDQSKDQCDFQRGIFAQLGANIDVIQNDALRFLWNCQEKFDIIFAFPPFEPILFSEVPKLVQNKDLLNENGKLVVFHENGVSFGNHPFYLCHENFHKKNLTIFGRKDDLDSQLCS